MALSNKSLILYNYEVTPANSSIDFKNASLGPTLLATLRLGFYSLTALMDEISRAISAADGSQPYTVTANRTISGGLENRVTISTGGAFLSLLFNSGPRAATSIASLIGFNPIDQTGSTSYTGSFTSGVVLIPTFAAYQYLGTEFRNGVFGAKNVAASGKKETIVFAIQKFWQAQFKYEPKTKIINEWNPFMTWAIQQRLFEFTPDVTQPTIFYEGTLETSPGDSKGLGFKFTEMLPNFPNLYDTGLMTFRLNVSG